MARPRLILFGASIFALMARAFAPRRIPMRGAIALRNNDSAAKFEACAPMSNQRARAFAPRSPPLRGVFCFKEPAAHSHGTFRACHWFKI